MGLDQKKETLVVNILGGPGVGKSTTTAAVFSQLKVMGVDCEIASEYAKELVWEQRNETFKDELYIFAKQAHRLFRLNGKVDVVVTDRPLILTCCYATEDPKLCEFCYDRFSSYKNLNYLLLRNEENYEENGRNQTLEEAKAIDEMLIRKLDEFNIPYQKLSVDAYTVWDIVSDINYALMPEGEKNAEID